MKKYNSRNTRIIAINNDNIDGFDVYLDFSGHYEYVSTHRHNGILFNMLKDGIILDDFRRSDFYKIKYSSFYRGRKARRRSSKTECLMGHLIKEIDDYLNERECICA